MANKTTKGNLITITDNGLRDKISLELLSNSIILQFKGKRDGKPVRKMNIADPRELYEALKNNTSHYNWGHYEGFLTVHDALTTFAGYLINLNDSERLDLAQQICDWYELDKPPMPVQPELKLTPFSIREPIQVRVKFGDANCMIKVFPDYEPSEAPQDVVQKIAENVARNIHDNRF